VYAESILDSSFWYSYQQPKCMMEKRIKKLQTFQSNPNSMTATKNSEVSALVLKLTAWIAMQ
jgi:hypothetical protein